MFGKTNAVLTRIATALERIADALESSNSLLVSGSEDEEAAIMAAVPSPMLDALLHTLKDDVAAPISDAPTFEREVADSIKEFLASRGITIRTMPPEDPADQVINSLSLYLGERYDSLKRILAVIKRNMQQGAYFQESIKNYSQQSVSDATQFCTHLHDIAFLEEYEYFRSPRYLIKAKTTTLPKAQNFFSGQWLERFVLQKVQAAVSQISREKDVNLEFAYLLNPQIVLP